MTTSMGKCDPTQFQYLVGLDVGATKIEAIAVDEELRVHTHMTLSTDASNQTGAANSILDAVSAVLASVDGNARNVLAIGLGVPGQIRNGVVELAVNLKMKSFPLGEMLFSKLGIPVVLENDVRTATLGAYQHIVEREPINSLAYLSIGTGIAAGVILDGKLYRGSNGMAGEIGHLMIEPDGPRCNCGAYGCLEAVAAGPAYTVQAQRLLQTGQPSLLRDFDPLTAQIIYLAALKDDPIAQQIVQKISVYLSRAIQLLIMTYDVEKVVLGGGVSHDGDLFLKPILAELAGLRAQSELANIMLPDSKIALMPSTYNAGLWGAIALARQMVRNPILGT
jgi:glucokinase